MSIINSVRSISRGFGAPTEYVSSLAQNIAINGARSFALTGFVNPVRAGLIRFKPTSVPANTQITAIKITATDGTTTITLYQDAVARTAAELVDFYWPFVSDLYLTTITVIITLANAGTAATGDFEVGANN